MEKHNQIQMQVFTEYRTRIFGYISKKNVPESDKDDVFSEILLKAAGQAGRYDSSKSSVSTWVYMITRSVVADYFKKRKAVYPLDEIFGEIPGADPGAQHGIEYEEELKNLARELLLLPEREREVIISRFYKDMEYSEIARFMNLSQVNVRKICSRALKKLKEKMTHDGG
ncbi:MAG: sigma-70 family RNA polymerase sigma factor [Oscillospiraceae bacterium]|nr:sigma-70 family RNA polymerase sigma factor [Oscillospiraceae bacterium]